MNGKYAENVHFFKALSDAGRLMIIDMLSCGELCACEILEQFNFTQPTLSHHMKILCDCGLVHGRKEGKWMYYSLDEAKSQEFRDFLHMITEKKDDCICKKKICTCEDMQENSLKKGNYT
jgi:ArsR family transcriptional regulator